MLARSKLSSIESKISEALINNEIKKINLIEEDKKIGINKVIKPNEIINNSLKPKI